MQSMKKLFSVRGSHVPKV